ncbi:hypothetical protein [Ammoniphilus resinae]|uniref:Uncharacterized protein n=1 Tax=Ammoniphilus resinae TaxID=861532 RepID=A0ABS4GNM6_9BACL|nr:hypothetical protein [Ammoniphilus resinae]MBP1931831.1 hypothetical protein [Ammoniphilus resinae]
MDFLMVLPGYLGAFLFFASPIWVPILLKRWVCLTIVLCANVLFFAYLYYLSQTSDVTEYGTGMAFLYIPFTGVAFIIGMILDQPKK